MFEEVTSLNLGFLICKIEDLKTYEPKSVMKEMSACVLLNIIFRLNTENVININIQIMRRYKFHLKIIFPLI